MSSKLANYFFGRLNIISDIEKKDKPKFIYNALNSKIKINAGAYIWSIFNVERVEYNNEEYYFGILVKYQPESEEDKVNEADNILEKEIIIGKAKLKHEFVYHVKSGIIAYHVAKSRRTQFENKIIEIIKEYKKNVFISAEIQTINDEFKVIEEIKNFDIITKIEIELQPSNPTNRDRWKKTDERLREMEVEKYTERYIGDNIKINKDDEAYGNILMAGDGYGVATIKGFKDDESYTVSTKKLPVEQYAEKENSQKIIKTLSRTFNKILERFDKK